MKPLTTTTIYLLPDEILLNIIEATGPDIKNIKLRQVSTMWKSLMDEGIFKKLFNEYEKSPILKSIAEQIKELNPNENHFQRVKAVYLAIKGHIKDFQKTDPSIKNTTLSAFDLERLEKIYLGAPNLIKVFARNAQQSSEANTFLHTIKNCSHT